MRKLVLFFSVVLLASFQLSAQNQRVTGVVTGPDGSNLAGVTVILNGTNVATITGGDGVYSINAPANGTLDFRLLGMESQQVSISGHNTINVQLAADATMISEVVITGYGTMSRTAFTGVASSVGSETLAKRTDASFLKSLEGNVPGVIMNNSTSAPGAYGTFTIRGRGSLNSGTQPLYVIDGIPINSDPDSMRGTDDGNAFDPLASINSNDIENVTILKDAAATAIYGSRASNGVVVVTTKRATPGKFNLNLDVKQGFVAMSNNNMKFANAEQTLDLFAKGRVLAGQSATYEDAKTLLTNNYKNSWGWDGVSSYDWVDAVTRNGYYQDYTLSASGSSESLGYYASLGYMDTEGLVIGSDMSRFSGRVNLNSKFKVFSFGLTTSFSYSEKEGFGQGTGGSFSNPLVGAVSSSLPFYPFYDKDGNYANTPMTGQPGNNNPLAIYDSKLGNINSTKIQNFKASPYLQVDFGLGIYAKTTLGVDINEQRQYEYWSAQYSGDGYRYNGLGQAYDWRSSYITWNNILGWNYTFNQKHTVGVMLGQEMLNRNWSDLYYSNTDFPFSSAGMRDLSTAGGDSDSEYSKREARLASYFFDGHYSYDNKYVVAASYRRDGSSVFGGNKLWGDFWSVSAKWRISNEEFLRSNRILTSANIRVSYGTVGNQDLPNWYAARGLYETGYNYGNVPGMIPGSVPNPDLTWETSKKLDIGFDVTLIDRINVTFSYYNNRTTEAIFSVPVSQTTGLTSTYHNIGSLRNRGVELSVSADIVRNENLVWNAYANVTFNQNRVIKLAAENKIVNEFDVIEVGRPYRQFYLPEYVGVDRETGKPLWLKNRNDEGDQSETTTRFADAAKRYQGSADPKAMGGFGTSLTYKGFDFNLTFNYRLGAQIYDRSAGLVGFSMTGARVPLIDVYKNSWTPENKDAKYPQWITGDPNGTSQRSSRFLYNANFLRIGNIALGYTLPDTWTKKIALQKLRVYVSADNVYTFKAKDFVGYTPESYSSGMIAWQYPLPITFTGGVQLTF